MHMNENLVMDYEHQGSIHDLFRQQASSTPSTVAIQTDDGKKISYKCLNEETDLLAQYLVQIGASPDSVIGIYMELCIEYVISYISILKSGAAYMPLDKACSPSVLKEVIGDTNPIAILTINVEDIALSSDMKCTVVSLYDGWQKRIRGLINKQQVMDGLDFHIDNLAYIAFTSGTTGKPKAVQGTHRGVLLSYTWAQLHYPHEQYDREACTVTFVLEYLRPLIRGATMYLVPDNIICDPELLTRFLKKHRITRMFITPALLQSVLNNDSIDLDDTMNTMRQMWLVGGVVTTALLGRCVEILPWVQFINLYGINECHNVAAIDLTKWFNAKKVKKRIFCPVGKVLPNVSLLVMNKNLKPGPVGQPGEIYIGGHGLARGYLNRPELNEQRFIYYGTGTDRRRYYRTGDWGYILADGYLEVCGRCDNSVKIRGHSIDIQVVESVILGLSYINAAVVIVKGAERTENVLVAYVVPDDKSTSRDVRKTLKSYLPNFMIPSFIFVLKSIPVSNITGKYDKEALLAIDKSTKYNEEKPKTNNEIMLAEIWKTVLQISTVEVGDNFFELGGHSLHATKIINRINDDFKTELTVQQLFHNPTITRMASVLDGLKKAPNLLAPVSIEALHLDLQSEVEIHDEFLRSSKYFASFDMQLRGFWRFVNSGNRWKNGRFLLTGATGFLGAFILGELLIKTQVHVYCIVRGGILGFNSGMDRIKNTLNKYGIIADDETEANLQQATIKTALKNRVEAIEGDVGLINMALSGEIYDYLTTEVDLVIHAAAENNLIYPYHALCWSNVIGTRNVLAFAAANRIKPLHYISTVAVFPHGLKNCKEDDDVLNFHQQLNNGYSQTKWVAEQLVLLARSRGLPVTIYRPGNLSGDSVRGFWNSEDFNRMMFAACIQTETIPDVDWLVEMTPVDLLANFIVEVTQNIEISVGSIYHVVNTKPVHWSKISECLKEFNHRMTLMKYSDWLNHLTMNYTLGKRINFLKLLSILENRNSGFFAELSTFEATNFQSNVTQLQKKYIHGDRNLLLLYYGIMSKHLKSQPMELADK